MKKRDLFAELRQGFYDLKKEREGKITLKSTVIQDPQPIEMSNAQIVQIREKFNYSQSVFASVLGINVSTLRNWEQGRSKPNAQAKLLLKLVDVDPSVFTQLVTLATGVSNEKVNY